MSCLTIKLVTITIDAIAIRENTNDSIPSNISSIPSNVSSLVSNEAIGNAGGITIATNSLSLTNGGQVNASTFGRGNAGGVTVNASETLLISGVTKSVRSGLFANALVDRGNGGNVDVFTDRLTINKGATITASNLERLNLFEPGTGEPGNIKIEANNLSLSNNASIDAATQSQNGSNANIDLKITNNLTLQNNSSLSAQALNQADGGNLAITANNVTLDDRSAIAVNTEFGSQGNINLDTKNLLTLRRNSKITTDATESATGGDITINSEGIALLDNSDITANAVQGQGGNIQIATQGIFQEPDSNITAASELGIDGTVRINNLDRDPSSVIFELPDVPLDLENILAQNLCRPEDNKIANGSSFVITGRGGIAPTSEESLENRDRLVNWATRDDLKVSNNGAVGIRQREDKDTLDKSYPDIQQAQGLVVAADGSTWLTANAPRSTSQTTAISHPDCRNLETKNN